jgi:ABC-type sugar transport system permease subunit
MQIKEKTMRKGLNIETKEKLVGLSFISTWLIGFIIFTGYPLLYTLYMAFNKVTIIGSTFKMQWIGFANFRKALTEDAEVVNNLIKVFQSTIIIIPIIIVYGIIMALLLNSKFKGRGLIRAIFFLPVMITSGNLIAALTIQNQGTISFLKSSSVTNLVASIGGSWGATIQMILNSFLIILWYSGIQMLLLIAGMQSINPSIYEAATIDGAGKWESLWTITLPGIAPYILISVIYTIVDQFTVASNPFMSLIYWHSQQSNTGYGYASAISYVYFVFILLIIGATFLIFRNQVSFIKGRGKR